MNATVVSFQQGDEIPEDYYSFYQWSPELGAMLVSGIFPGIRRSFPCWEKIDQKVLSFYKIDHKRIKKAQYVLNQWSKEFSPVAAIFPKDFLTWYNNIQVPPLDFHGNPLIFVQKGCEVESVNPQAKYEVLRSANFVSIMLRRFHRENSLTEPILQAIHVTQNLSSGAVFTQLKMFAEKKIHNMVKVSADGLVIDYKSDKGGTGKLDIQSLKKRLSTIKKKIYCEK